MSILWALANFVIEPAPEGKANLNFILLAVGSMDMMLAYFFRMKVIKLKEDRSLAMEDKYGKMFNTSIISWAMACSVGVIGMITILLAGDYNIGNILLAFSMGLIFWFHFPSLEGSRNPFPYKNENK